MWLFSLVSLVEMQLVRLIRHRYPDESWKELLGSRRIENAEKLYRDRQTRNEETHLLDCLQLCDKRDILLGSQDLLESVGLGGKNQTRALLTDVETLRNDLAHANDIIKGRWPGMIELVENMEALLGRMEKAGAKPL